MSLLRKFGFAWKGLRTAWREEISLRIHIAAMTAVVILGIYFGITSLEWCAVLLAGGLVITLELVNTALENLTDLMAKEIHPLAGKAKDIAASAVLVAAVLSVIVGILIFGRHVMNLF